MSTIHALEAVLLLATIAATLWWGQCRRRETQTRARVERARLISAAAAEYAKSAQRRVH